MVSAHARMTVALGVAGLSLVLRPGVAVAQSPCPAEPALFHSCALARARTFVPPRTSDGRPDLQGFWRGQPAATENVEEHPKTDDDDGGRSLIVDPADGRIPYQPWAAARRRENRDKYIDPNV